MKCTNVCRPYGPIFGRVLVAGFESSGWKGHRLGGWLE